MKILNFGSLNIDHVYRVPHINKPGETLASNSYEIFAGGKGANQSVALARAGAKVSHAGKLGQDGNWLKQKLNDANVNTELINIDPTAHTGHAIIQVDNTGENAIVLHPGANHQITRTEIDNAIKKFSTSDIILLQNEINDSPYIIEAAARRNMKICFNPAPFTKQVLQYPLKLVDILIVNEPEAAGLANMAINSPPADLLDELTNRYKQTEVILTRGSRGVMYRSPTGHDITLPAQKVNAVDTTAAGDTFIGYYLASIARNLDITQSLQIATHAAAICVTKSGAIDSIPSASEIS